MTNIALNLGLTFDDVLLVPGYSEVLPYQVDTTSYLTKNIQLKIPIISAAMDTVTEYKMAIALARNGGIGIIHKNMSIDAQAEQVNKVKRSESGLISDPVKILNTAKVSEAKELMDNHKIKGIPVVDIANKLVGILTNRDLRSVKDGELNVADFMTKNPVTAQEGITMKKAGSLLDENRFEKLPIVNTKGELAGLITYRDITNLEDHPDASKDAKGRLLVGAAVGLTEDTMERVTALHEMGVDVICLDSAHGHSKGILDMVASIKKHFPKLDLIAGNVATAEGAKALVDAGADAVKVGIGPGSICTTRVIAGVGVPQLTAIMNVSEGLKGTEIPIIADGGIKQTGDIVKAIAAGASTIMAGSVFAGTDESPGETILFEGRKFKTYRGMGSEAAMKAGSGDRYFQGATKKLVPEGVEGRVPYKGVVEEVLFQMIGGLCSGMGYTGSETIPDLWDANFVRITAAGVRESHPHDVEIVRESGNYSRG